MFVQTLKLLLFLASLAVLHACGGGASSSAQAEEEAKAKQRAKPKAQEPLTAENAAEQLMAYAQENKETTVVIATNLGDIKVRLYEETPMHRANFLMLAKMGYFDETYFHRVVPGFVIQGGGTDVRKKIRIGNYRVPAEFMPDKYFHKRGAIAMARYDEDNPKKESDSHEFYIVWGEKHDKASLKATSIQYKMSFGAAQALAYTSIGGAPHLDGQYTVFGEVVEGLDVVGKIAQMEVDKQGWPLENVSIKMKALP